ncbi:MAG: methyltransferase [Oscillospiraceae bacterium]|nr:methyltransferase [Oscillospiraceae bacterium]
MFEIFEIGRYKLCVSKQHRFGTDALKLAEFALPLRSGQVICDLCTGCGIIPFALLNLSKVHQQKIYAVDISDTAIELLQESVKLNNLTDLVVPVHEDLKTIESIPRESIDLVTMNPPYYKKEDGYKRADTASARHEILCNLDDAIAAAARLLKYGGRLKMCHVPERMTDVLCTLRQHNLEPKRVEFLTGNKSEPWLMLIEAKKGGRSGVKVCTRE